MEPLDLLPRTPAVVAAAQASNGIRQRFGILGYLTGPKSLLIVAAGLVTIGLVAWVFGTAAVVPLLYSLPCAAMMALCMRGHGGSDQASSKSCDRSNADPNTTPRPRADAGGL